MLCLIVALSWYCYHQGMSSEQSDAARVLAASRRIVSRHCEMCGKPMKGTVRRRYCSAACDSRAYYGRHRELICERRKLARDGAKG